MKKRILAILLSALLTASTTACNYVPDNVPQNTDQGTVEAATENLAEALQLSNTFSSVLKNEVRVCDTKNSSFCYLNDAFLLGAAEYANVSVLDLDDNGATDVMVLESGDRVVILKEHEGTVYAWAYRHTALYSLRTDGTYYWSEQAGRVYGSSKMQFDGAIKSDVELYRTENNEKFYINEIEVSREEYETYVQNQKLAEIAARYWWETGFEAPDDQLNGK